MVINEAKTQLMCMSQAINYDVNAFVRLEGKEIEGGAKLKILGFHIGKRGDMAEQVKAMKKSFAARVFDGDSGGGGGGDGRRSEGGGRGRGGGH